MNAIVHAIAAGLAQSAGFFWDSLFGLIFGFLVSAIVQVVLTPATMERYLGPNLKGILFGAGFGIISSACSYGAAAATRGFYRKGGDVRAVFSFLISSTNMNVAIVILFWSLLGWKFAFAEFFGGAIIIAIVAAGFTALFRPGELERLHAAHEAGLAAPPAVVEECPLCGMEGEPDLAVTYEGTAYWCCGTKHRDDLQRDPQRYVGNGESSQAPRLHGWAALRQASTWREIAQTALADVRMLRAELVIGYLIAGFASALVPTGWLAAVLHAVGAVPYIGYLLLLIVGLAIAVVTFVCSMGNVPVARFLAGAGIPLGANTTFIYGDLLIPPLIAIYRKSFPARIAWTFVALFIVGAVVAGAVMEFLMGGAFGGASMGSMALNDRFTLISNLVAVVAVLAVAVASQRAAKVSPAAQE
jgi:uncharacterized membrane protein YraQ (UPF0718 family)